MLQDGLRKDSHKAQLYVLIFIWRRVVFILSVMYLPELPTLCVILYNVCSFANCTYLFWALPFEDTQQNIFERFNEIIVWVIGVHECILLGFVDDFKMKEMVGDSVVFFALLMLGINASVVFVEFFRQAYASAKNYYNVKMHLRRQQKIQLRRHNPARYEESQYEPVKRPRDLRPADQQFEPSDSEFMSEEGVGLFDDSKPESGTSPRDLPNGGEVVSKERGESQLIGPGSDAQLSEFYGQLSQLVVGEQYPSTVKDSANNSKCSEGSSSDASNQEQSEEEQSLLSEERL